MSEPVIVAMLVAIPPTLVAMAALIASLRNGKKTDAIHVLMNSRLDELLAATRRSSHAEGVADEVKRSAALKE